MRKIVIYHLPPPIPLRDMDFVAFYDGEEEAGHYGYGATPVEALADFLTNYAEDHDKRLDGTPAREPSNG